MVDLGGYVIILVETNDKRVKLYGSPADKADLEVKDEGSPKRLTLEWDNLFTFNKMKTKQQVADEILEINGKPLHNSSHTEVINHIHNVRKRRCILEPSCFVKLIVIIIILVIIIVIITITITILIIIVSVVHQVADDLPPCETPHWQQAWSELLLWWW